MFDTRTAAPYSRHGEPSVGASSISVRIYASSFEQLEERFEHANQGNIIGDWVDEERNGRWCRRWVEARQTLAEVINFPTWNRRPKPVRKGIHRK